MADYKEQVDALASLMEEFRLGEASLTVGGFNVAFRRHARVQQQLVAAPVMELGEAQSQAPAAVAAPVEPKKSKGNPIESPMNGIYYRSPSPAAPPFVRVGDTIEIGQVIGLIEAMKVFNEIPSPIDGVVLDLAIESGSIVQPGDVLIWVENP